MAVCGSYKTINHNEEGFTPTSPAAVYGSFSYLGLVVINNSGLDLPSLWIAYLPMFVGVYALTIWIDQKFSS